MTKPNEITVPTFMCELDSHADTCCLGRGCHVLYQTDTADVSDFTETLGKLNETPVITGVLAYDDPESGATFLLYFHQALYLPQMDRCLLNPNQMREAGVMVNDVPLKFLPSTERNERAHAIVAKDSEEKELVIPMDLRGIISQFKVRKPTAHEIENMDSCYRIDMTNATPEWRPNDSAAEYDADERKLRDAIVHDTIVEKPSRDLQVDSLYSVRRINGRTITIAKTTHTRKGTVQPQDLATRWNIGLKTAERTFEETTQLGVRDFNEHGGSKRLRHTAYQLRHRRLRADVYTDTLFAETKSLDQHTCGQIFATDFGWVHFVPMRKRSEAPSTLPPLFDEYGIFNHIVPDNAPELTSLEFKRVASKYGCRLKPVEAWTPNQNLAEANIRELKRIYRREMRQSNAPAVLWDHCLMLVAERRSHTSQANGNPPPIQILTGDTPDISHLIEHKWYDFVWYSNPGFEGRKLGRWLGPSHSVGQAMCAKILTEKGKIVHRTSVWPITRAVQNDEAFREQREQFTSTLGEALGARMAGIPAEDNDEPKEADTPLYEPYEDDEQADVSMPEADHYAPDSYDKLISAKVMLPLGDNKRKGTVKRRKRDADGKVIGTASSNPLLDTSLYEVEFDDGHTQAYAANIIAESIFEQLDEEGNRYRIIDDILDHKKDASAIPISDGEFVLNGQTHKKKTTRGWFLCIQWKDGSTSWERLKDLKESYPLELAQYAVANKLDKEPAFNWWVPFTIKRSKRLIKAVSSSKRYMRTWQKYGVEVPKTVERALEIDRETGTDYWRKALQLEMSKIFPCMKILEEGSSTPIGYQTIPCHIVFDVKMDFTRKARYVAGGHKTSEPEAPTYASVVSRDSVRIGFLMAALNGLDVLTADIAGAYLNAPCLEKVCTVCGLEFGPEYKGRIAIITRALYGLKTSAYAWRELLSTTLQTDLGYKPCRADPDVYIRPSTKADGMRYYEMLFVYTDDILVVSHKPQETLTMLDHHYLLKPDSIGIPKIYLGNQVEQYDINNDASQRCWALSSNKYAKAAIQNVSDWLEEHGRKLKTRVSTVLPSGYRPEMDVSPYCDDELLSFYQQQLGVLRWLVELGRIDITTEVSMLAAFLAGPREGHVEAMLHLFAYLKFHDRSRLVLDPSYIEHGDEPMGDWTAFYPNAKEEVPLDAPEPLGNPLQMTCFVDSDHAGDLLTRRSRTGVLIYLNRSPILWYSKKQTSVETSTFGSEFMALKVGIEMLRGLRYKLRMMGIPLDGHAHVRCDNMSVVSNSSKPESTLKKKSNAVAYHYVRENVANGVCRIAYEPSTTNLADLLTKVQTGPERTRLAGMILF